MVNTKKLKLLQHVVLFSRKITEYIALEKQCLFHEILKRELKNIFKSADLKVNRDKSRIKSRIRETQSLSTDANSITIAMKRNKPNWGLNLFFFFLY